MSGRRSRDKSNRVEHAIVPAFQRAGSAAERAPLSGTAGGRFGGDVAITRAGRDLSIEVKLYDRLQDRDALIVKAGRREPLAAVRMSMAAALVTKIEETKK